VTYILTSYPVSHKETRYSIPLAIASLVHTYPRELVGIVTIVSIESLCAKVLKID
jgi:hypothetical protein